MLCAEPSTRLCTGYIEISVAGMKAAKLAISQSGQITLTITHRNL